MTDYTICFDARWILYPLGAFCALVFGIGLGHLITDVRKHFRRDATTDQVAQQQRLKRLVDAARDD